MQARPRNWESPAQTPAQRGKKERDQGVLGALVAVAALMVVLVRVHLVPLVHTTLGLKRHWKTRQQNMPLWACSLVPSLAGSRSSFSNARAFCPACSLILTPGCCLLLLSCMHGLCRLALNIHGMRWPEPCLSHDKQAVRRAQQASACRVVVMPYARHSRCAQVPATALHAKANKRS